MTVTPGAECTLAKRRFIGGRMSFGGQFELLSYRLRVQSNPIFLEKTLGTPDTFDCDDMTPPKMPPNVQATAISDTEIEVTWTRRPTTSWWPATRSGGATRTSGVRS